MISLLLVQLQLKAVKLQISAGARDVVPDKRSTTIFSELILCFKNFIMFCRRAGGK